jgi:CARDB
MKWLPSPETRAAVLKHPFFLAGLAVVVLLGLTAAVLVIADSVRGGGKTGTPAVVVAPAGTTTPGATSRTASASGVSGTTRGITAVRSAPGTRTPVLGTLEAKIDVEIDGRTTDAKWMRVVFPPNSSLHGWIDATNLDIIGDPASLVVATAEPPVVVELPTEPPAVLTAIAVSQTPQDSGTATATSTPGGNLPDLAIDGTTVSNGKLFITVVNQGKGEMKGDLVVAVFNSDATKLLGGATLQKFTLAPGRSIDIGTGYVVTEDQTLFLVVNPNGDIAESNTGNNNRTVAIAVGEASRTPLPGAATPTPDIPATLIAMATATAQAAAATPDIPATLIALATETAQAAH